MTIISFDDSFSIEINGASLYYQQTPERSFFTITIESTYALTVSSINVGGQTCFYFLSRKEPTPFENEDYDAVLHTAGLETNGAAVVGRKLYLLPYTPEIIVPDNTGILNEYQDHPILRDENLNTGEKVVVISPATAAYLAKWLKERMAYFSVNSDDAKSRISEDLRNGFQTLHASFSTWMDTLPHATVETFVIPPSHGAEASVAELRSQHRVTPLTTDNVPIWVSEIHAATAQEFNAASNRQLDKQTQDNKNFLCVWLREKVKTIVGNVFKLKM